MNKNISKIIKSLINSIGYDLNRLNRNINPTFRLLKALNRFNVDLVLDVGANSGQFAAELIELGYNGEIVSFEPLSSAHNLLISAGSKNKKWQIYPRCAIGDFDGEIEINISKNSVSSSVLPMSELHLSSAKDSVYVGTEKVPIFKLDTVARKFIDKSKCAFLKIDTQGFEWEVLNGCSGSISHIKGILCELSLEILYDGQHLWMEMIERFQSEGFVLWSIQPAHSDIRDGRTLQVDAVFFRKELVK